MDKRDRTMGSRCGALRATLLLAAAVGAVTSCSNLRTLKPFFPCGGDLTGTWTIDRSSLAVTSFQWSGCMIESDLTKMRLRGTWEFGPDMTYRFDLSAEGKWVLKRPSQCGERTTSCEEVQEGRRALLNYVDDVEVAITCSGTAVCTCVHEVKSWHMRGEGSYAVTGTRVSLGTKNRLDYCVAGDTLRLNATYGEGALGSDDDVSGTLRLVRHSKQSD
jgi:hypothetical protein